MGRYRGRHSARHAAPRTPVWTTVRAAASRPAVTASMALAVVSVGALAMTTQEPAAAATTTALGVDLAAGAQAELATSTADRAALATAKTEVNTQKAVLTGQAQELARQEQLAAEKARAAEAERAAREAQRTSILANSTSDPKAAARLLMGDFGFGDDQWGCLDQLVTGESTWNYRATNPSSGAYGLFQSLPANKMDSVATDWADNPSTQIIWGLGYIKNRYGTPCGALSAWLSRSPHWY